ncbi:hypothetical protein STCU_10407 [Strigomonas culicis]|uniref:Uncharacterized protein n=1 Tax=Strigomonas culicis TaxID=28005 RepID=S9TLU9_9TRYP|nr:hypothetical protein STCU_10407 [Strigomonas culicis]|eukprot:EPY17779.1 hypothetical protein STCU_10407 [Strigomonas culicis]
MYRRLCIPLNSASLRPPLHADGTAAPPMARRPTLFAFGTPAAAPVPPSARPRRAAATASSSSSEVPPPCSGEEQCCPCELNKTCLCVI